MASSSKSAQAFRTISEVATELDLPQHVLRFWETKFNAIKPMKRGGGRRYYRPDDIVLLQRIRGLLYDDGYTIKGVQKLLREGGGKIDLPEGKGKVGEAILNTSPETISTEPDKAELKSIMAELEDIQTLLRHEG
ncbi:MAG TPA: MerR family transcriptional regulator [Rhodospirillales bacterium]|nr:MerR family transcriptional regulator [Rhodospirillales bacterium]